MRRKLTFMGPPCNLKETPINPSRRNTVSAFLPSLKFEGAIPFARLIGNPVFAEHSVLTNLGPRGRTLISNKYSLRLAPRFLFTKMLPKIMPQ